MPRNTICVSNLREDLHEWIKETAKQKSDQSDGRITMSDLFNEAVTLLKQKYDDEEALEKAKSEGAPWLKEPAHVH